MKNIIRSEFYKAVRSKTTWIIAGIYLLLTLFMGGLSLYVQYSPKTSLLRKTKMMTTGFQSYIDTFGGNMLFYVVLIGFVAIIANDYSNSSIRQISCHGVKRWKHVLGQYLVLCFVFSAVLILDALLNLIIFSGIYELGTVNLAAFIRFHAALISLFLAFGGIGSFLGYLTRSSGIGITISIVSVVFLNLVPSLLGSFLNKGYLSQYAISYIQNAILDLNLPTHTVIQYIIFFVVIAGIFLGGSILLYSKRDID